MTQRRRDSYARISSMSCLAKKIAADFKRGDETNLKMRRGRLRIRRLLSYPYVRDGLRV